MPTKSTAKPKKSAPSRLSIDTRFGHMVKYIVLVLGGVLVGMVIHALLTPTQALANYDTWMHTNGCTTAKQLGATVTYTDSHLYPVYFNTYQTMTVGSSGQCVKNLQRYLNAFCSSSTDLVQDGSFGNKTKRAVMAYQNYMRNEYGLGRYRFNGSSMGVDGVVGPQTWGALQFADMYPTLSRNCS
jgi:hypothetical protein